MNIKNIQVISCQDWDGAVQQEYARPYCLQQQNGCIERGHVTIKVPSNDEDCFENETLPDVVNGDEMGVKFSSWLQRDVKKWEGESYKKCPDLYWFRNFYPSLPMLADDLYKKGLLPAGEYRIDIDW